MMKVAIYARGNNTQVLDDRIQTLRNFAQASGLTITAEYTDVGSALKKERPGLRKLEEASFSGEISAVLVTNMENLSRNPVELFPFLAMASGKNIQILTPSGVLDTSVSPAFSTVFSELHHRLRDAGHRGWDI